MTNKLSAVSILEQRVDFLEGMAGIAKECNWPDGQVQGLMEYLHDELIDIDNLLYDVYEETGDHRVAFLVWENQMEDLRRWLGLILGIRIRYI